MFKKLEKNQESKVQEKREFKALSGSTQKSQRMTYEKRLLDLARSTEFSDAFLM